LNTELIETQSKQSECVKNLALIKSDVADKKSALKLKNAELQTAKEKLSDAQADFTEDSNSMNGLLQLVESDIQKSSALGQKLRLQITKVTNSLATLQQGLHQVESLENVSHTAKGSARAAIKDVINNQQLLLEELKKSDGDNSDALENSQKDKDDKTNELEAKNSRWTQTKNSSVQTISELSQEIETLTTGLNLLKKKLESENANCNEALSPQEIIAKLKARVKTFSAVLAILA